MYGTSLHGDETKQGTPAAGRELDSTVFPTKINPGVEIRESRFHQALLAELFGTTLLVLFIVLAWMTSAGDAVRIGLVAGLTLFGLTYMLYSVSGAHFNPAVTLGVLVTLRMTVLRAFLYIVAQVIGAIIGAALARSVSIGMFRNVNGGSNSLADGISPGSGFWIELLGTLFFVMAYLAATDGDRLSRWPYRRALLPIEIGLVYLLLHVVLIPFTGCSLNPARSFGSAVVANHWRVHWIWWFAPLIGALLAAIFYSVIFFFNEDPKEELSSGGGMFAPFTHGRTSRGGGARTATRRETNNTLPGEGAPAMRGEAQA